MGREGVSANASAGAGLALLVLEARQEIVEAEDHADASAILRGERQAVSQ